MSKYTTEVRYICETYAGLDESAGYDQIDQIIHDCHNQVMGSYPIFDEAYRETLNTKILKHYYTREICEETVGLWKLRLNNRMNEIMPYYNKLYASELLHFNPYYDVDLTTTHIRSNDTNGNTTSTTNDNRNESKIIDGDTEKTSENTTNRQDVRSSTSDSEALSERKNVSESNSIGNTENENSKNHIDKFSETPQGAITGLANDDYLTNARIIDDNENNKGNSSQQNNSNENENLKNNVSNSSNEQFGTSGKTINNDTTKNSVNEQSNASLNSERTDENSISSTEDYLEHVQGKRGGTSFSKLLQEYRETFINIDKMIINELGDLFFGLW